MCFGEYPALKDCFGRCDLTMDNFISSPWYADCIAVIAGAVREFTMVYRCSQRYGPPHYRGGEGGLGWYIRKLNHVMKGTNSLLT